MGFLDSVKSHFKNNEEEEFERAFQEGAWPQGVELEPMTNTGSFLPATFEVDPLADASLPGNAVRSATQPDDPSDVWATESVVRAAGTTPVYAQPQAPSPFAVIDASSKPIAPSLANPSATPLTSALAADLRQSAPTQAPASAQGVGGTTVMEAASAPSAPRQQQAASAPAHSPYATPAPFVSPVAPRPQQTGAQRPVPEVDARPADAPRKASLPWERESGITPASVSAPMPVARASRPEDADGGVQVFAREGGQRAARPAAAPQTQKPFAERLRERVAAANVSGQTDDTLGRSRAALQSDAAAPARGRRAAGTDGDIDAELAERRRARRAAEDAREEHRRAAERPAGAGRARAAQGEPAAPDAPGAGTAPAQADAASALRPVPVSAVVIRARSYDDVREVAPAVMAQHRPAVLVLKGSTGEVARRVLDFSFGLCCGTGATMRELGDRVYAVLPRNTDMTDDDLLHLRRQGLIRR